MGKCINPPFGSPVEPLVYMITAMSSREGFVTGVWTARAEKKER